LSEAAAAAASAEKAPPGSTETAAEPAAVTAQANAVDTSMVVDAADEATTDKFVPLDFGMIPTEPEGNQSALS
jgi:hypothetical protein